MYSALPAFDRLGVVQVAKQPMMCDWAVADIESGPAQNLVFYYPYTDSSEFSMWSGAVGFAKCDVNEPMKVNLPNLTPDQQSDMIYGPPQNDCPKHVDMCRPPGLDAGCRWHNSANSVGCISADGHIFTKTTAGEKTAKDRQGNALKLASICMVFDETLRCGGQHQFNYTILAGELGAADGAGFVFDSRVRRNNIQRMRSVFLNRRGQLCVRDQQQVHKLGTQLPPLSTGMQVMLSVDLENCRFQFTLCDVQGVVCGFTELCAAGLFSSDSLRSLRSGFFCAVVTKDITVSLY